MDPSAIDQAEALLLKAGRVYGVPCRQEQVRNLLQDPSEGPSFAKWAIDHLPPDFLLAPGELAVYTALDAGGQVDRLAGLHDLAEVQAVREQDVESAVEELRRSTDSIRKQTQTLRQQRDALAKLAAKSGEGDARRQAMNRERKRNAETEHKSIAAEVEDLTASVAVRTSDLEQHGEDGDVSLNNIIGDLFEKDDKLLRSLQKLGGQLDQDGPEDDEATEKLRETCMRLIKTTIESVRTRLDTVYLETLTSASSGDTMNVSPDDIKDLEAEVESLYSEILPVAQMSVEQQHLEPVLRSASTKGGKGLQTSLAAVSYMDRCLDHLLQRITLLKDRVTQHKAHQSTASSFITAAKNEISSSSNTAATDAKPPPPSIPTVPASPIRNKSPVRSHTRGHSRTTSRSKRDSLPAPTALETLLSTLAVSLPELAEGGGHGAQTRAVAKVLRERDAKAREAARSVREGFEGGAASQLDDAARAVQLLRDSVFAESPWGEVRMVDGEIDESIQVLEAEHAKAERRLRGVDGVVGGPSEKRDEFLERWAR